LARWVGKKPVIVEFWATWCPICAELLPRLEAAQKYGDRAEFVVVAVAVNQSKSSVRRHLDQHPMPFTFLWDANGAAVRAFQAPSTSYVAMLDAKGRVVYGRRSDQNIDAALLKAVTGGTEAVTGGTYRPLPPVPASYRPVVSAGTSLLIAALSSVYAVGSISRNGVADRRFSRRSYDEQIAVVDLVLRVERAVRLPTADPVSLANRKDTPHRAPTRRARYRRRR
jgi:thiol-disulfide isomerase/thioredoxin